MRHEDDCAHYEERDESHNTTMVWERVTPRCLEPVEFFADKTAFTIFALLHTEGSTRSNLLKFKADYHFSWVDALSWYTRNKELVAQHKHLEERIRATDELDKLYRPMAQPPANSGRQ
jgi:hypothetical protein